MIYLASASPRRRELLTQIGIDYQLLSVDVDETVLTGELPGDYVARVAGLKARAGEQVAKQGWPVLSADTIVIQDGQILLKPVDEADAMAILSRLSGRTHEVKTAICVAYQGQLHSEVVTTEVTFRELTELEMRDYWHTGEPADKAGSYGIQGIGGKFVRAINGSYSSVVGLPLMETEQLLTKLLEGREV